MCFIVSLALRKETFVSTEVLSTNITIQKRLYLTRFKQINIKKCLLYLTLLCDSCKRLKIQNPCIWILTIEMY